jgi:hypothetical protein
MDATRQITPVQAAYDDLLVRTLSKISCDLARLIYLASTRDYNTGNYYHDGLSARFSAEEASKALERAHRKLFYDLAALSLEQLVAELERYVQASREDSREVLRMWQKLEPYRVAIPMEANPTVVRLFLSNIRLALAVWRLRQEPPYPELPSSALLPR